MADQSNQGLLSSFLRQRRFNAVRRHLRGQVLDYGCASGSLAAMVDAGNYLGVDIDAGTIESARRRFPRHQFLLGGIDDGRRFDTVVLLALIEHVKQPATFLAGLAQRLAPGGRIVMTTPHPAFRRVHDWGARIGLFSAAAAEEHESFLGLKEVQAIAAEAEIRLVDYRRFLFGANQLFVLESVSGSGRREAE
ncbi:MAG: methyltransferase domain-containing protein [Bryobacteraceae bacterium]|nr:methyltransferase domain-containing protein [Bryobacteraceae bacterium]